MMLEWCEILHLKDNELKITVEIKSNQIKKEFI